MDFALYRTAHGAFPEEIPGEFTAFVLPPDADLAAVAPRIQNALVYQAGDALHILHLARLFELLPDKAYRGGRFSLILDGVAAALSGERCTYCLEYGRRLGAECEPCRAALAEKYARREYRAGALLAYLEGAGGRRLMPVLLHKDETFVRLHADYLAEGRQRDFREDAKGYNPRDLTFDRKTLARNELIVNAEMAERTGKMQALKFEDK